MSLVTLRYKVASAGFQPGDIVTVEDTPYVRARYGTTFEVLSAEATEPQEAPQEPESPVEPVEPPQAPQEAPEAPSDDDNGPLPE